MAVRSKKVSQSFNKAYISLALLIGLYTGINLSGFYRDNSKLPNALSEKELQKAIEERNRWKAKAIKLEIEASVSHNRVEELEHTLENLRESKGQQVSTSRNPNSHPICQQLSYPTPSALALWNEHIHKILDSSKLLPNDYKFKFHDFTAELLQIISPRLPRSVKSIPKEWASVELVMTIAWERYQYMSLSEQEKAKVINPPRPVKILIMGGSLLVGRNCRKIMKELGLQFAMPNRVCTWSNRLEQFLNQLFDGKIVEVTKIAMGGTNTATGSVIFQYDLVPEQARDADIVINAYSTNDMHILTILEAQSSNTTLRDKVFDMTQSFVRQVLHSCDPRKVPPLLIHVDDYLGNEQRKIWETTELSQGVQVLASYYGFSSVSYSDLVREIVYGDTAEKWFSSDWWETGKFEREIHPGMGMHISSTWATAYNLLNMLTTYCSLPSEVYNLDVREYKVGVMGLPALRNDVSQVNGKPHAHPLGLPPLLTKDLLIEDVTQLWKNGGRNGESCESGKQTGPRCPFSWISGLSLQQNNQTWIEEYFRQKASRWKGWKLSDDGGKTGFVPTQRYSSEMVLEFSYPQTIRSVTLFFMKSYGPKWENSQLKLSVNASQSLDERDILGFHAKQTSEVYTEEVHLKSPITNGKTLQVKANLVKGTTFKLMGLAICS